MKKLGIIVNPLAGLGGRVGLKGSDGADVIRRAKELGALPEAPGRAVEALSVLREFGDRLQVITYPGEMGEAEVLESGLTPMVIGSIESGSTTSADTQKAARRMEELDVDLLLFSGGDGTARDIFEAVGRRIPALGIPAGVKLHSAVYAVTPMQAGVVASMFLGDDSLPLIDAEVMDIDEEAFRGGRVSARLYGYLRVPEERRLVQAAKSGGIETTEDALLGIAVEVIRGMEPDCLYLIGPGTTTAAIMNEMGLEGTLLGVDVVLNKALVARDVNEGELLDLVGNKAAKIIVTAIGGQGHIFGRGNQQLSAEIIGKVGKENLAVVASRQKLASLAGRPLMVDTGDPELDRALSGYIKVTTGPREYAMYRVGM